jgi:hypothetical protein
MQHYACRKCPWYNSLSPYHRGSGEKEKSLRKNYEGTCILIKTKLSVSRKRRIILSFLSVFFLEFVDTACSIYQHFLTGKEGVRHT